MGIRKQFLCGIVAAVAMMQPVLAQADNTLAQSNTVKVTGGYMQSYSTQVWEQTGTTSRFVQTGTQTVLTGYTTQTTTVATEHSTWISSGYWVDTGHEACTTCGYWSNGKWVSTAYWVDSGYWVDTSHYGPPYYYTYDTVTTQVPVYSTVATGYYTSVPVYGWVTEQQQKWVPATVN